MAGGPSRNFFLILTFFSLLGAILVFGYIIFYIEPSKCGPFSGFSFMYEAILQGIFQLQKNNTFWKAVVYLAKPGVIGAGLIAMVIATYILRAKAQAQTIQVAILQNILETGIKDKAFLFKFIKRIEEMNRKEMSPSLSHSSSFRTPLSERTPRRASKDNQPTFQEDMALGSLRKFHSTSHLAPIDNLYYYKGHQGGHDMDQPSSSSGTSKYTNDIELLQMDYQTSHQYQ